MGKSGPTSRNSARMAPAKLREISRVATLSTSKPLVCATLIIVVSCNHRPELSSSSARVGQVRRAPQFDIVMPATTRASANATDSHAPGARRIDGAASRTVTFPVKSDAGVGSTVTHTSVPAPETADSVGVVQYLKPPRTPAKPVHVLVGAGWGCVALTRGHREDWTYQCWQVEHDPASTRAKPSRPVQAFKVPWLTRTHLGSQVDRLCGGMWRQQAYCWWPPHRGQTRPIEVPRTELWSNPYGVGSNESYSRPDFVTDVAFGRTFTCLQSSRRNTWCFGDDDYGQLGSSSAPPPSTGVSEPVYIPGMRGDSMKAGTWHACALENSHENDTPGKRAVCWGRGDYGQLGPLPDRDCVVNGREVRCAKTPVRGPYTLGATVVLGLGDLFTCWTTHEGVACWGANRDGFFGEPGSCPEQLRQHWPTLGGSVPAPRAACTHNPVHVAGTNAFEPAFEVGPRGFCLERAENLRCFGGIPMPRGGGVHTVRVSRGDEASACGIRGKEVVCWGDGYSPAGALDLPTAIRLDTPADQPVELRSGW